LTSINALVAGMGLRMIGVPPTAEEILRIFAFIFISIIYGAFWMSLSVLFSVVFKRIATALLASIGLLILFFLIQVIAPFIATAFIPDVQNPSIEMLTRAESIYNGIIHISPLVLYNDGFLALLAPELNTMAFSLSASSGITPGPLPLAQSVLNIWPQTISLIALTAICFAISYVLFMREEIRST
jgi:ABC-2 type transport system permease protein